MTASTPRRTATVGDVIKRHEDDGLVTFWRIEHVQRDVYGLVVHTQAVR